MKVFSIQHILPALFAGAVVADPRLVRVLDAQLRIGEGIPSGTTPQGNFLYFPIASGTVNTTTESLAGTPATVPLRARILPGGSDYAQLRTDGSLGLGVTAAFQGINDPSLFHVTAYGYEQPGINMVGNVSTKFGEYDSFMVLRINTNSTRYGWINSAALVGQISLDIVNGMVQNVNVRAYRVIVKER